MGKIIGMHYVEGEGVEEYQFPEEYYEELREISKKARQKLESVEKWYERVKQGIIRKEYEEIEQLQLKYLREAGFKVM